MEVAIDGGVPEAIGDLLNFLQNNGHNGIC